MRTITEIKQIEQRLADLGLKSHNAATELCRRAGIDDTTYRRWRSGETSPTKERWDKIVLALLKIEREVARNGMVRRRHRNAKKARRRRVIGKPDFE